MSRPGRRGGRCRPEPPAEPTPATDRCRRHAGARCCGGIADILLGKARDAGAGGAGVRGSGSPPSSSWRAARRSACEPGVGVGPGAGQPVGGAAAAGAVLAGRLTRVWVGAPPRLRRLAAACAAGAAVRRRRGGAGASWWPCFAVAFFHFGIQAWFNDPVRDSAVSRVAAGLARLSGRAPRQHPRRRAGDGERSDARRPVPDRRSVGVRRGAGRRRPRCAA